MSERGSITTVCIGVAVVVAATVVVLSLMAGGTTTSTARGAPPASQVEQGVAADAACSASQVATTPSIQTAQEWLAGLAVVTGEVVASDVSTSHPEYDPCLVDHHCTLRVDEVLSPGAEPVAAGAEVDFICSAPDIPTGHTYHPAFRTPLPDDPYPVGTIGSWALDPLQPIPLQVTTRADGVTATLPSDVLIRGSATVDLPLPSTSPALPAYAGTAADGSG